MVGAGNEVGWTGLTTSGLVAGVGSGAGGADTHAAISAVPSMLAIPFSFIIGPWRERCHRPISRVLSAKSLDWLTVISLDAQSPTRSSSLPAASLSGWTPFAAYLALLPLGFAKPHVLPRTR